MMLSPTRQPRFGVQLQAQRVTWPEYIAAVRAVEEMGFDSVWTFDHMLPFAGPVDAACFETWTTLAAMATATSTIRIGALVNGVLYRDPATLAKSATQVDLISDGRLEFALGAAWAEREFRAYGLPFPPAAERLARLDEALELVKLLWTQPRTTYRGRYYTTEDAPCEPKPVQRPYPPIMVGGGGRTTLRLAAKHATGWNGIGSPTTLAERIAVVREDCEAIGRDPGEIEFSAHPPLSVARSHDQAVANAQAMASRLGAALPDPPDTWLLGTPAEVQTQVQGYLDAGITSWIVGIGAPFDFEGLRLFADEVMPAFR